MKFFTMVRSFAPNIIFGIEALKFGTINRARALSSYQDPSLPSRKKLSQIGNFF